MKSLFVITLCICGLTRAQDQIDFLKQNSFYINGDATIIGNNIVSKGDRKAFNDFTLINDQIKMTYVDVDHNASTFSSSSATLNILDKKATIKSAVLYWSAIYPYTIGVTKETATHRYYVGNDTRETKDINKIKFKTPNSDYIDLTGTLIYDGFNSEEHKESSPYVCYKDVTSILTSKGVLNGEYTVANINATEGYTVGGSAGGWLLFIIYESEEASSKLVSSYHGFAALNDSNVDVVFSDFKTKDKGVVNASIFAATLEGDSRLYKDVVSIYKPEDDKYITLKNKLRSNKNFFNSKITIDNAYFSERKPNSTNTLGFDLLQLKLPKGIIQNSQTESTLRLGTKADRFFLFFTAFKTEISEVFHMNKEAIDLVVENENTNKETEEIIEVVEEEQLSVEFIESQLKQMTLDVPDVDKGYYLITNVYSDKRYANRWRNFLTEKGYTPKSFINPKNNWEYIYVYNDVDIRNAYKEYQKLAKHDYFKEIWVFKINMD